MSDRSPPKSPSMAGFPLFAQGGHKKITPKKPRGLRKKTAQNAVFLARKKSFLRKKITVRGLKGPSIFFAHVGGRKKRHRTTKKAKPKPGKSAQKQGNSRHEPRRSPRASGAENANDGKAPSRHQDGTDQHPRSASRPKPPGHRTGRTRDVVFSESIDKCRGEHPDRLFALRCIVG